MRAITKGVQRVVKTGRMEDESLRNIYKYCIVRGRRLRSGQRTCLIKKQVIVSMRSSEIILKNHFLI